MQVLVRIFNEDLKGTPAQDFPLSFQDLIGIPESQKMAKDKAFGICKDF
jgi:hypothetical protein